MNKNLANNSPNPEPRTAIIVGAGCSVGLGVPAMLNYMDEVYSALTKGAEEDGLKAKECLSYLLAFVRFIKGSAASIDTQFLDVEELYGLAEMARDLDALKKARIKLPDDKVLTGKDIIKQFNRALMYISVEAGKELVTRGSEYEKLAKSIEAVKRESQIEEPGSLQDRGPRHTNLLAYLGLASFKDTDPGAYPLIVQINWDLAYDRALLRYFMEAKKKDKDKTETEKEVLAGNKIPWMCYKSKDGVTPGHFKEYPLMVRPHGGINMLRRRSVSRAMQDAGFSTEREIKDVGMGGQKLYVDERALTEWNMRPNDTSDPAWLRWGDYMAIEPPTWKKDVNHFLGQWQLLLRYLKTVRRIVIIGYSLPRSDLYMRHFLALALARADYVPEIYVWNPDMTPGKDTWENYREIFAPLLRRKRLYVIDKPFGDPALFDLNRAIHLARRIEL